MRTVRTAAVFVLVLASAACGRSHPTAPEAKQSASATDGPELLLPDHSPRRGGIMAGSGS
ncbi:MAG TPA: hypothetical protein VHG51_04820 [Longimicrobiaceae bacterium]|nr:hypothetical protein [Longimicrobiaceae bacterium]